MVRKLRDRARRAFRPVRLAIVLMAGMGAVAAGLALLARGRAADDTKPPSGEQVFRFDTFGDEQLWTDTLRMHEVIEASLDPITALLLGLKIDVDALPDEVIEALENDEVDLTDPATTLLLIDLNAVVGVQGTVAEVDGELRLTSVGITCALCHSTVDDAFAAGIGHRLDGWPNSDLDSGAIIALSPAVPDDVKAVYNSWGPGMYDPRFNIDGLNTPLVIWPALRRRPIPPKGRSPTGTNMWPSRRWVVAGRSSIRGWASRSCIGLTRCGPSCGRCASTSSAC